MNKKPLRLPQSLYDALKSGEEIGKKPLPPSMKERLEKLQKRPPRREEVMAFIDYCMSVIKKRQDQVAKLQGAPQQFKVVREVTYKCGERYLHGRYVESSAKQTVTYAADTTVTLFPVKHRFDYSDKDYYVWVWVDNDGWTLRDGQLTLLLRKGLLKARE